MTADTYGDVRLPSTFWVRVRRSTNGCWHWTGAINEAGYGTYWVAGQNTRLAHRHAYHVLVEALAPPRTPEHRTLDHECHNRSKTCRGGPTCLHRRCVNPAHVTPKTTQDNTDASRHTVVSVNRAKTRCIRGHELSGHNLLTTSTGNRNCRTCQLSQSNESRRRRLAAGRGSDWAPRHWQADKTHCPQGHEYAGTNVRFRSDGSRVCRTCNADQCRRRRERRAAQHG